MQDFIHYHAAVFQSIAILGIDCPVSKGDVKITTTANAEINFLKYFLPGWTVSIIGTV